MMKVYWLPGGHQQGNDIMMNRMFEKYWASRILKERALFTAGCHQGRKPGILVSATGNGGGFNDNYSYLQL